MPTTINADKELAQTFQPLLLAHGVCVDGTEVFLSTHDVTFDGDVYAGRIEEQDIEAIQSLGPQGIDSPARITLHIQDGDLFEYSNLVNTVGFAGSIWQIRLVLWEAGTANFSNAVVKFYGISNEAQEPDDSGMMTLEMSSKLDFQRVYFPPVKIQKRCPHFFPKTAEERQAAADNSFSRFFACGYSPDASGGEARGNYETGTTPFPTCDRTYLHCIQRMGDSGALVQIEKDTSARATGVFGGIQNDPPDVISRAPKSAYERVAGSDSRELGSADSPIPLVYGMQWVRGIPASQAADANITGQECVLSYGKIGNFLRLLVNGIEIPRSGSGRDSLDAGFWGPVNDGNRRGFTNVLPLWANSPRLDPYGSIATAVAVVPRQLSEAGEAIAADFLIQGRLVRVYSDASTYSTIFSENPVWILLDLMVLSGQVEYTDFQISTLITAAAVCSETITAPNLTKDLGGPDTLTHARYKCSFTVRDSRSLADIIRGIRNAAKLDVRLNDASLIEFRVAQTLADQQPSPVSGSNFDTAIQSKNADGGADTGYVAYRFDESSILRNSDGKLAIARSVEPIRDAENSYHARFQNEERLYTEDSVSSHEAEAVQAGGKENTATAPILGPTNYDQHLRVFAWLLARRFRGNPQAAAIGTWSFDIETTIKGAHLKIFDIVLLDVQKYALDAGLLDGDSNPIDGCLCRVTRISPGTNYGKIKLRLEWHDDNWYVDTFGQQDEPAYNKNRRDRPKRPPHPWQGYETQPSSGDALYDESEYFFGLAQRYEVSADGAALARLKLVGKLPVNIASNKIRTPSVPIDGSAVGAGGTIDGDQTVWIGLTALDADGKEGALSELVQTDLPSGSNFAIDVPNVVIPSGATGYVCYAGIDPRLLTFNHTSATSPTTVTVTDLNVQFYGPPDPAFERIKVRAKIVEHAGVFGVQISSLTATTITVDDALWTTDEWAGRAVSILGFEDDQNLISILHFEVVSNTSDTLTFSGIDLVALGIEALDVITMRSKPTAATANTYTDSKWLNSLATLDNELPINIIAIADVGGEAEIQTANPHGYTTGDYVRVTAVGSGLNAVWQITVTDTDKFTLDGSTYAAGTLGQVRKIAPGLTVDEEKGRIARIIAGPGRGTIRKIIANTSTQITIDGEWGIDPTDLLDSTIIIEQGNWSTEVDSSPISNSERGISTEIEIPIENLLRRILLVEPVGVNREGKESIAPLSQEREIFVFGKRMIPKTEVVYGDAGWSALFDFYGVYVGPGGNIEGDTLVFSAGGDRFYETPYTHAVFESGEWVFYYNQWRMKPIYPPDFSWNTGSDADSEIGGATTFTITPGTSLKFFGKAAPATPYTIIATLMVESREPTLKVGLGWRQTSGGKIEHTCYVPSVAEFIGGERWTDENTPDGIWISRHADLMPERVVQIIITNDGSQRTGHYRFQGRPSGGTGSLAQDGYARFVGDYLDEDEVGLTFYNDRTPIPGEDDGEVDVTCLGWQEFPEIVI